MFKFISIDIETTGLDPEVNQIVEVGAVYDTRGYAGVGSGPAIVECRSLPKFRAVLMHDELVINPYCANLHKDLWEEMLKATVGTLSDAHNAKGIITHYVKPQDFERVFHKWLCGVIDNTLRDEDFHPESPVTINVAGKNPAGFDIPFLLELPEWSNELVKFRRRIIDPAMLCFVEETDTELPDLQTCLDRCSIDSTVKHTAVEDALDVIKILRRKWL